MQQYTLGSGRKTKSMAMELKPGKILNPMKESTRMTKRREKDVTNSPMDQYILVNLRTIK
jgi:hypothetical protein